MALRHTAVAVLILLGVAQAAAAQDVVRAEQSSTAASQTSAPNKADAAPQSDAAQSTVDVSRLPVNVSRIQRQLQQSRVRDDSHGLNLRYVVDVYGRAPRIDIFTKQDNLINGPVPYGAPTHSEILRTITPQEYRAPVMDFSALMRWLKDKGK